MSQISNNQPTASAETHCSASDTPETDALANVAWDGASDDYSAYAKMLNHARKLERERNAAIKMAWELVQEMVTKCDDPIHAKQFNEIEQLHHAWTIPQNSFIHEPAREQICEPE